MLDKEWWERKTDDEKQETSPLADHRQLEEKNGFNVSHSGKNIQSNKKSTANRITMKNPKHTKKVTKLHTF